MNVVQRIIGALRPLKRQAEPEQAAATPSQVTHSYRVEGDELVPTAQSLNEYYEIQDLKFQAREVLRTMQYAETLLSDDNTPLDTDPREGHVKLPEHGFESHPESGFSLKKGEVHVAGDSESVRTTRISDNSMATNQSATWSKQERAFTLTFQKPPEPEVHLAPDNRIEERAVPASEESRASDLIKAAEYWEARAKGFDNTPLDIHGAAGHIVAPGLSSEQAGNEKVVAETFYVEQNAAQSFGFFDLEFQNGATVVAGNRDNRGRPFGPKLTARRTAESMEVVFTRPEIGTTEKVEWVLSDGVLHYEKYKKG